jgi:hypothetical protein
MDATLFDLAEYAAPPAPEPAPVFAVNLHDLTALRGDGPVNFVGMLLQDYVTHPPLHVDTDGGKLDGGRLDGCAIILDGPAAQDADRTATLIDFLQTSLGPRKLHRRVRCYRQGPRGGWREIRP